MISATLCAIIFPAPVVQVLPLERRSDRTSVFETGLTRARHEPAIGATKSTRLVGLRRSLASVRSHWSAWRAANLPSRQALPNIPLCSSGAAPLWHPAPGRPGELFEPPT